MEIIANTPGNINATLNDSQATFNGSYGVASSGSGVVLVTINRSTLDHNGAVGAYAAGSAGVIVALNDNNIARNRVNDIERIAPAVVRTFFNNALSGESSDVSGALTGATRH